MLYRLLAGRPLRFLVLYSGARTSAGRPVNSLTLITLLYQGSLPLVDRAPTAPAGIIS